jgi:hypothetical protein
MSWSGAIPAHLWFKEELQLEEDIKMVHDKNVRSVIQKMIERSKTGLNKYGVTTERDDLSLLEWVTHAQEEAMDLAIYLERIKQELGK